MKTDENYAIEIIVWVGGSVVYEGSDIVKATEIEKKYKQQNYDDVVKEIR